MNKIISNINSANVLLLANETFNGLVENVSKYESVSITINSNRSSATDGIKLYLGPTADNLINKYSYSYTANDNKVMSLKLSDSYFKLTYTNGNVNQTSFYIECYYSFVLPTDPIYVKLNDSSGNGITSTNSALDVNIKNTQLTMDYKSTQYDLFGNIKISSAYTLLDVDHIYDKCPLLMDEYIKNGGTSQYQSNDASVLMTVSANNDIAIRQSRLYTNYQPGKALCIRMTGVLNAKSGGNESTTTSRIGYFDEANGLFFQYSGGIYSIVKRKGTTNITTVNRSSWDDPLNGTGPSGVNVDLTKNLIYFIEFAFLGVGIVRMGFVYSGNLYIAHTFTHTDLTYPYISTPNLPIRWELISSGGGGQLICTCGSVQSEGGYNIIGNPFSIGMMDTGIDIDSNNIANNYIMCIRLKSGSRRLAKLISLSLACTTSTAASYNLYIIKSPTTIPIEVNTGTPGPAVFSNAATNSDVEYHLNTSNGGGTPIPYYKLNFTNAILLYRNYFTSNESLNLTNFSQIGGPIYLTAGIDSTSYGGGYYSDYLILTARRIGTASGDELYYGSMNWLEI